MMQIYAVWAWNDTKQQEIVHNEARIWLMDSAMTGNYDGMVLERQQTMECT